ncbi:MAG: hypothetical protein ACRED0_00560 [Gammaproteobacteria bacterium]
MEQELRKLAWAAWASWSAEGGTGPFDAIEDLSTLQHALESGTLVSDQAGVRFSDPNAMVLFAAEYVLGREVATLTASPKTCFERLDEMWVREIGKENLVSGQVLAALHNSRQIDAFAWACEAVEMDVHVFDVLHVMEGALPHFQHAEAATIFRFLAESNEKEKNGVFCGALHRELEGWLPHHPEVARELMRLHEVGPGDRGSGLYGVALHALIQHDFQSGFELAVAATASPERLIARPALNVLGLVEYSYPDRQQALERTLTVCSAIVKDSEHPLLGAVTAASRLIHPKEPEVAVLLEEAARTHKPEALYALSDFLFRERKNFWDRIWFWPLVMHVAAAEAPHKGTLDNVDCLLSEWLKDATHVLKVIEFLNAWIGNQSSQTLRDPGLVKVFDSTVERLAGVPTALSAALTAWLLHPDARYPMVAYNVLSKLRAAGLTNFGLDTSVLDALSEDDLGFLVRRILGYLFGHDIVLPLLFSMVHTRDAMHRTFGFFVGVVRDRLGYDYPEETLSLLKAREQAEDTDAAVKELCATIVREIEARQAAEDALPLLKEFYPSPEKVRRFAKERHRQMAKAMEEAEKEPIFSKFATQIPLKAGRRTFQRLMGRYTDVTELKSISHSIPIPRTEIADPLGSQRERFLFRRAKKGEP